MAFLTLFNRRWSPTDVSGLLAEYRFADGSGTTLTDHSGNGNHGTLGAAGAAPTWAATGLTFDGGDRVTVPVALADVRSVVVYATETGRSSYNVVLSSDNAAGLTWGVNNNTGNYKPNPFFWVGGVGEGLRAVDDTFQQDGGQGAAWVQNGAADALYVNGWPCPGASAGAGGGETSATGRIGDLVIGANPGNGALAPFVGTMSGMLLYSTALTASQVAQAHAYLAARAAARGLTPYASGFTGYRLWAEGDSITAGTTIVTDPTVTASGLYAQSYSTVNRALAGNTIARIAGGIRSRTLQQYSSAATRNVLWLFAGTNDIYLGGLSAAATFSYLAQTVQYATSVGFKVVVCPMLSRTSSGAAGGDVDARKNTYNSLISAAAAGWGSGVRVIPLSALAGLVEDGAYAGANFSDGTHPTQAASDGIIAPAFVTEVDAFG